MAHMVRIKDGLAAAATAAGSARERVHVVCACAAVCGLITRLCLAPSDMCLFTLTCVLGPCTFLFKGCTEGIWVLFKHNALHPPFSPATECVRLDKYGK